MTTVRFERTQFPTSNHICYPETSAYHINLGGVYVGLQDSTNRLYSYCFRNFHNQQQLPLQTKPLGQVAYVLSTVT
jgi:hypothetical protein